MSIHAEQFAGSPGPAVSGAFVRAAAPLRMQVVDRLRSAIVTGRLPSGERLIERVLCEELAVSRTVVREALRQLEAEKLIEMVPHVGSVVRRIDEDEARSLYEVRAALESLAARRSATDATPEGHAAIEEAFSQLSTTSGSDVDALLEVKDVFTRTIFEAAGNEVASAMLASVHARVSKLRKLTLAAPGRAEQALSELAEINAAISRRDPAAAESASRAHVNAAARIALAELHSMEASRVL